MITFTEYDNGHMNVISDDGDNGPHIVGSIMYDDINRDYWLDMPCAKRDASHTVFFWRKEAIKLYAKALYCEYGTPFKED